MTEDDPARDGGNRISAGYLLSISALTTAKDDFSMTAKRSDFGKSACVLCKQLNG